MKASYGFIETRGYIAAIVAADAMVKAAKVELLRFRKVGAAFVTIIVKGELAACQAAVEAGAKAARQAGQLVAAHIIARPYEDTEHQVEFAPKPGKGKGRGKKRATAAQTKGKPPKKPSPGEQIERYLKNKKGGATLKQLAEYLQKSVAETRKLVKELMDQGKVEKIQQRYFPNV
jgi:microcompartment protein CcmL/EutN